MRTSPGRRTPGPRRSRPAQDRESHATDLSSADAALHLESVRPRGSPMSLKRRVQFFIDPVPPFSFGLTVRKPAGWDLFTSGEVYDSGTLWTGIRHDGRTIGLRIEPAGTPKTPRVLVTVYAASTIPKREVGALR